MAPDNLFHMTTDAVQNVQHQRLREDLAAAANADRSWRRRKHETDETQDDRIANLEREVAALRGEFVALLRLMVRKGTLSAAEVQVLANVIEATPPVANPMVDGQAADEAAATTDATADNEAAPTSHRPVD